jgi:hypothetical protein
MLGFGLVLNQLHPVRTDWLGYGAVAMAAVVIRIGLVQLQQRRREIQAG